MSNIPASLPYNEDFSFYGVRAKDMTRVDLLKVICHLAKQSSFHQSQAKHQKHYKIESRKILKTTQEELEELKRRSKND